jgi:hypothetical protein
MRKIAIVLILFQLIGCAKQPVVTTRPEKKQKQEEETLQDNTSQVPKAREFTVIKHIGAFALLAVGIGALSIFFISRARKVYTPVPTHKPAFIAKSLEISAQDKERQQKDVQDSPMIKKWFNTILAQLQLAYDQDPKKESDTIKIKDHLMAAYNYSTDHMIRRLRNQTMQNKNGEMVSLFTGAREEVMLALVEEKRILDSFEKPIESLPIIERDGQTYSNWTFWQLWGFMDKTRVDLTTRRETNPAWDSWLPTADRLLFFFTEYAYYCDWREKYIISLTPEPAPEALP